MPDYIGHKPGPVDNVLFGLVIVALCALFVVLTQPAWRGEQMVAEMRDRCDQRGGIMLEDKKAFGTSYECVEPWGDKK